MGKPFSVNTKRFDPYKNYRFLVYLGQTTTPAAGMSKVSELKRSSEAIEYKEAGNMIIQKGLGRTKYEPLTLERGVTHDREFIDWANAPQVLDKGAPSTSLANLRRDVRLEVLNEAGQAALRYIIYSCWVSEFTAMSALDAGGNGVAVEIIKLEHHGWEQDTSLPEPTEV